MPIMLDEASPVGEPDTATPIASKSAPVDAVADQGSQGGGAESNDKRDRRIAYGHLYSEGVAAWRAREEQANVAGEAPPGVASHADMASSDAARSPVAERARVFVRVRPLFEHEAGRGEWECVSTSGLGVTLHEGTERVQSGSGVVKALRHHHFPAALHLADDEAVFSSMSHELVSLAAAGSVATLFMLGMTGSGKTYNMDVIHGRAPFGLFETLETVGLISYELVGKKTFDLLTPEKGECQLRTGEQQTLSLSRGGGTLCNRGTPLALFLPHMYTCSHAPRRACQRCL